jgi:hypothetical protein
MMARENVLKLDRIRELFNGFCRDGHKFYADLMDAWIVHPNARKRLFGINAADYQALSAAGNDGSCPCHVFPEVDKRRRRHAEDPIDS